MENSSNKKHYIITLLLIAVFFAGGIYIGTNHRPAIAKVIGISGKETAVETTADFAPFWDVWNKINEKYPGASEISDQEKVYGAIAGLVASLEDPYTVFFSPEEAKSFEEEISGNFTGIGMEVGIKNDILTVIAPLKDTPAFRAGIKAGDQILKINDTITTGVSVEEAVKLIRGEKGTPVTLTILSEGGDAPKDVVIVRDIISIPTLDTELRSDGIFVIELYSFTANSPKLFRSAIKEFAESKSDKLILDLRGNPGGYLNAAIDITSWFLPSGKIVVTEDYGDNKEQEVFRSKGYDVFTDNLKFVILIDEGSASASEIVAGALKDHGLADLVGAQSFGKGSVQEVVDVTSDTILKITVAKWLTPNGASISEKGLTPDYEVEFTREDMEAKKDPQMDKAVEVLLNK